MEVVLFTLLGLAIGSFLNVVILRVPENQNIAFPSSHCPKCKTKLKFYHNIPVVSWVALRGKCAFCHEKISFQYPLIELITALIFVIAYLKSGTIQEGLILGILFALLLALSMIDLRYKAVPDILSFPVLFIALFSRSISESVYGALLFMGGFSLLRMVISWLIKKEAMGEADIIIAGVIGGVLGVQLGLGAIYIAAVIALPAFLIVGKKGFQLPFIPFLTLGLYITWVFDTQIATLMGKIYG